MSVKFQERKDTAANWISVDPTLLDGEWGLETDTRRRKMGDGVTAWTELKYEDGDYIIDFATEGSGNSPNNPYIAGTHGETRLLCRCSDTENFPSPYYVMLPSFTHFGDSRDFKDDQIYQLDGSLADPIHLFIDPTVDWNRCRTRTHEFLHNGQAVTGITCDSLTHYLFEAYPSNGSGRWTMIGHQSILFKSAEAEGSYDGWGNNIELTDTMVLGRFTANQNQFRTELLRRSLYVIEGGFTYTLDMTYDAINGHIPIPRGYKNYILDSEIPVIVKAGEFEIGDEIQFTNTVHTMDVRFEENVYSSSTVIGNSSVVNIAQGQSFTVKLEQQGWFATAVVGSVIFDN